MKQNFYFVFKALSWLRHAELSIPPQFLPLLCVYVCARVHSSHLEVLYSRGLLCSVAEDWVLTKMPATVLQEIIKRLKFWRRTQTWTITGCVDTTLNIIVWNCSNTMDQKWVDECEVNTRTGLKRIWVCAHWINSVLLHIYPYIWHFLSTFTH